MSSFGIPKSLPPYVYYSGSYDGDCSAMICSRNCLQWCINVLPPPPPPDDDSGPNFSPLIIVVITILASALFFVTVYTICTNLTRRRRRRRRRDVEANLAETRPADGEPDDEAAIVKNIKVFKYKKGSGENGDDATECSVCLAEFQEDESLRLLPKCSHVFHLICIDTWLKSQPNCPICRTNVVVREASPPPPPPPPPPASTSQASS